MLQDRRIDRKLLLSALWASVIFCYIYADYFGLFSPERLAGMMRGEIPPLGPATDGVMLFVSAMMIVPSLMIFLSVALPAAASRLLNLIFGLVYSAIICATTWGAPAFYLLFALVEVSLTLLAVYCAWTWPRQHSARP